MAARRLAQPTGTEAERVSARRSALALTSLAAWGCSHPNVVRAALYGLALPGTGAHPTGPLLGPRAFGLLWEYGSGALAVSEVGLLVLLRVAVEQDAARPVGEPGGRA